MKRTGSVRCTYVGYTCVRSLNLSVGLVYAGGPFYGYVVQVHVVVLCACVHLHVDMLISSHLVSIPVCCPKNPGTDDSS